MSGLLSAMPMPTCRVSRGGHQREDEQREGQEDGARRIPAEIDLKPEFLKLPVRALDQ